MKLFKRSLQKASNDYQSGVSLPELTAAMALVGIFSAISLPSIQFGRSPLADSSNRVTSLLKFSRSRAMAQTSAYRISPANDNQLKVEYSTTCNSSSWDSTAALADADLKLDQDVVFSVVSENGSTAADPGSGWSICFDSRGYANKILTMTLSHSGESQQVQIFRGGTVSVQ